MDNKRVVWEMPDGAIRIGTPVNDDPEKFAAKAESMPGMTGAIRLPDMLADDIPSRRFRDCWRKGGQGRIATDMPLARLQRMGEIRRERDARLFASDEVKHLLDDTGTSAQRTALATKRQELRDVPAVIQSTVDAAKTSDALATVEPTWPVIS